MVTSYKHTKPRLLSRCAVILALAPALGLAQVNGVGHKPYLGWSSFSQQTISSNFLTQANIQAQSDALRDSGLQSHGFDYINMDSGWQGSFDNYGRPIPNLSTFPDIAALVAHIHANGQKAGIYWIPGIEAPAVDANSPILGTPYHIQDIMVIPYAPGNSFSAGQSSPYHRKIDFSKPGAQEYINSVVDLFASWGIDFIKLDGVTPGSYVDDLSIDNRPDVEAWSKAIAQSKRPIWFTVSWALAKDYLSTWQQFSNARRIEDDVECEGRCSTLTDWPRIAQRAYDLVGWQDAAGVAQGWNDMDSLDVGYGSIGGLTQDEQRFAVTLWSIANAPLYLGGDLTQLDDFGKQLFSNDEVLAVDQSAHPPRQILGGFTPVWSSDLGNGNYYVALFNLNDAPTRVTVAANDLGFAFTQQVRDLWTHSVAPNFGLALSAIVPGHGARLFKVKGLGPALHVPSKAYEGEAAKLTGTATVVSCPACSGGAEAGFLGVGPNNNATFDNIHVPISGVYEMQIDSMTFGPRALLYSVNGAPFDTLNVGGGSFNLPASTTVPVHLNAGANTIVFGNPTSYPPGLDRIIIKGFGLAPAPTTKTYEAENATLSGSASAVYCEWCSGASKAGNLGGSSDVTFNNISVDSAGTYQLEIDYLTSGVRTFLVSVNGGANVQLDLNGDTFDAPAVTVLPVQLKKGVNTIQFSDPGGYAPDLDRIVVGRLP
jgi:alpha-galactosidase